MISRSQLDQAVRYYGFTPRSIDAPLSGYRNHSYRVDLQNGQIANLIAYKTEPGILKKIRAANTVSNYLATSGLPARSTLDPRILRLTTNPARYAALYHYLPGITIPWDAYTMEHLKLLGAAMAHMHAHLCHMPPSPLRSVSDEYQAIIHRMGRYFADPLVIGAIHHKLGLSPSYKLARSDRLLQACTQLPHQQPLHMDFVRGNILFSDTLPLKITGILDFEKTAVGHPVFDLARTLAFLLVDCKYKTELQIRKYFLYSGYLKRGGGELPPSRLFEELINLFLLYDFYKFLRHNPYEFLCQNQHFIRTRKLLQRRQLLQAMAMPTPQFLPYK